MLIPPETQPSRSLAPGAGVLEISFTGGLITTEGVFIGAGGQFFGSGGSVTGPKVRVLEGGALRPGLSPGHLIMVGDFYLSGGSLLGSFDQAMITGAPGFRFAPALMVQGILGIIVGDSLPEPLSLALVFLGVLALGGCAAPVGPIVSVEPWLPAAHFHGNGERVVNLPHA